MKSIIKITFLSVMGMRIANKSNLIQKGIEIAVRQNMEEMRKRLETYFSEKGIKTEIVTITTTNEGVHSQIIIHYLEIAGQKVDANLLIKEKGLVASTERTTQKLCKMLEELFDQRGIKVETTHKVVGDYNAKPEGSED